MKKLNEKGIGLLVPILIVIIFSLIIGIGYYVYTSQNKNNNLTQSSTQKEQKEPEPENSSDEASLKPQTPLCGSKEAIEQTPKSTFDLKYSIPTGWAVNETYPNGVLLASQDFASEKNLFKITSGATISLTQNSYCTKGSGEKEDLLAQVSIASNDENTSSNFITVSRYPGVEFSHNNGENRNNHKVVIFLKDDLAYTIEEQYGINSDNPYPDVIDEILKTVSF